MFLYTKGTRETVVPAWFSVVPAVLGTTSKLHNIYVFIYKLDLEQRGSCVVQRGSSHVENNVGVVKHICFHIQMAPGPAWFLRGSAWFQHSDNSLQMQNIYVFIHKTHLDQRGSSVVQRGSRDLHESSGPWPCLLSQAGRGG